MNTIIPWVLFSVAAIGIAVYGTWGRGKRRSKYGHREGRINPRKAA